MRNAETVLGIISERGRQGLPLTDAYRQLFNRDLFLRAYGRIYSNDGAMTPGTTSETVDGMSLEKIDALIETLKYERYRWTPVKRVYIPKKNGKMRPLGIPTWSDKLLQEVIRMILEAYYEPQFSRYSHGFRPDRGCHTALTEIVHTWKGTRWFIEGDISKCFDSLDHKILLSILGERIQDNRFLRLISNLLETGYLEDWKLNKTLSGSPQGGIVSPILSNIYLDKLDQYVERELLPAYTQGETRKPNKRYRSLLSSSRKYAACGNHEKAQLCRKQALSLPAMDTHDPKYRRLRYVRYADDWLLGYAGTHAEAEEIKARIRQFLKETLHLELSEEKTLITHAQTEAARFLGYEIVTQHRDDKIADDKRRRVNGQIGLRIPADVLEAKCSAYAPQGKPMYRPVLMVNDDFSIIAQYQSEYRGLVQYYLLAQNIGWLGKLKWYMEGSLLRTLAAKHQTTVKSIDQKYKSTILTPQGAMKCLEMVITREGKQSLIARFGGIPLHRKESAVLKDQRPIYTAYERNELLKRLLADECEICGSTENCEVHHIRKLADLNRKGRKEKPAWMKLMAARRRKTLVVCRSCHKAIHSGHPITVLSQAV